jgi:hypothetical protein
VLRRSKKGFGICIARGFYCFQKGKEMERNSEEFILWDVNGHHATDLEEVIGFAFTDGVKAGRDDFREEIKNLLLGDD